MSVLGRCINNEMPMTPRLFRCENTPDRKKKYIYKLLYKSFLLCANYELCAEYELLVAAGNASLILNESLFERDET